MSCDTYCESAQITTNVIENEWRFFVFFSNFFPIFCFDSNQIRTEFKAIERKIGQKKKQIKCYLHAWLNENRKKIFNKMYAPCLLVGPQALMITIFIREQFSLNEFFRSILNEFAIVFIARK